MHYQNYQLTVQLLKNSIHSQTTSQLMQPSKSYTFIASDLIPLPTSIGFTLSFHSGQWLAVQCFAAISIQRVILFFFSVGILQILNLSDNWLFAFQATLSKKDGLCHR